MMASLLLEIFFDCVYKYRYFGSSLMHHSHYTRVDLVFYDKLQKFVEDSLDSLFFGPPKVVFTFYLRLRTGFQPFPA